MSDSANQVPASRPGDSAAEEYDKMMAGVLDQYRIYQEVAEISQLARISSMFYESDLLSFNDKLPLGLTIVND